MQSTTFNGLLRAGGIVAVIAGAVIMGAETCYGQSGTPADPQPVLATDLKAASSFAGIGDARERSIALFEEAAKVMQHPRCANCHPAGNRPFQTNSMRPHEPLVVRGEDGHGAPGMTCTTCHHDANFDPAGVPGDPHWHLAPASMAWAGKSVGDICEQLKDRSRNGDRDIAAIIHHATTDSLVLWGWNPGAGRTPAPGSAQRFGELLQAWAGAGAHCPPT